MKSNKLLIALALCAAMQSNVSFASEMPETGAPQGYWQRTKNYAASWVPQSIKNTSTKQKAAMGSLLLAALVGYYYRDLMMQNATLPSQMIISEEPQNNSTFFKKPTLSTVLTGTGGVAGGSAGGLGGALVGEAVSSGAAADAALYGAARAGIILRNGLQIGAVLGGATGGFVGIVAGETLATIIEYLRSSRNKD